MAMTEVAMCEMFEFELRPGVTRGLGDAGYLQRLRDTEIGQAPTRWGNRVLSLGSSLGLLSHLK